MKDNINSKFYITTSKGNVFGKLECAICHQIIDGKKVVRDFLKVCLTNKGDKILNSLYTYSNLKVVVESKTKWLKVILNDPFYGNPEYKMTFVK